MAANDPPLSSTHPNCIFIAFADCVLKDLWETEQQHCIGKAQLQCGRWIVESVQSISATHQLNKIELHLHSHSERM